MTIYFQNNDIQTDIHNFNNFELLKGFKLFDIVMKIIYLGLY